MRRLSGPVATVSVFLCGLWCTLAALVILDDTDRLSMVDVPASFGPRIGQEGLKGQLFASTPSIYGCEAIVVNSTAASLTTVLLVLQRSPVDSVVTDSEHCSFEQKIRNAQAAGASLAIVFDSIDSGPLVRMKADKAEGIYIPAVFINHKSGGLLLDIIAQSDPPRFAFVDNGDPYPSLFDSVNLTMLALVIGFLLIVLVCGTHFLCSSSRLRRPSSSVVKNETLPMEDVLALPEVSVGPESEYRGLSCPVCLEEYSGTGERLKILPCRHVFHTDCIAPWLCERQRTCPLCKESVVPSAAEPLLRQQQGSSSSPPPSEGGAATSSSSSESGVDHADHDVGRGGGGGGGGAADGADTIVVVQVVGSLND